MGWRTFLLFITYTISLSYTGYGQVTPVCAPPTDFSFSQDPCNPLEVQFTGSILPGYTYGWIISGTNYAAQDPTNPAITHTFPAYGSYPVTLTVTSGACSASVTKTIPVQIRPGKLIGNADTTVCSGTMVVFRTQPLLDFCWSPAVNFDSLLSGTLFAAPTVTTTYHLTAIVAGENLVMNGDFENGNTGFTSGYQYAALNSDEGQYVVGSNAQIWHGGSGMEPCPDHTTGRGNMMIVNGAPQAGVSVWTSNPMNVAANTNYAFSVWIESVDIFSPSSLQFSINGTPLGNPVNADSISCSWHHYYTIWNSGSANSATVSLINNNIARFGNDFALDDISFAPVTIQQDSVTVAVKPLPHILAAKSNDIDCSVHSARLDASGGSAYSWTPAAGLSDPFSANPVATPDRTTTFTVNGAGSNGCIGFDTVTVRVTASGPNSFVVPNAFSPNGDGHNDCFGVNNWGGVQLEELDVFNRAGVKVFATRNPSDCWDGTFNGKPQPPGAYVYVIKAFTFCGEMNRRGTVILVR
jgi:gliding motility-associated-like protein